VRIREPKECVTNVEEDRSVEMGHVMKESSSPSFMTKICDRSRHDNDVIGTKVSIPILVSDLK
jgi:hypothetical protein